MPSYNFGSGNNLSKPWQWRFPKEGLDPSKIKNFLATVIDPKSDRRIDLLQEANISRAYYLSDQWLKLDSKSPLDSNRTVRFTRQDPRSKIPRPVENEIMPIVDNEAAKEYRRKSSAYVRPLALQESTGAYGGGITANGILDWHLETIHWPRKWRSGILRNILYGTVYFWSYLDQSHLKTVKVGITDARRCQKGCDFSLSSLDIPEDEGRKAGLNLNSRAVARDVSFDDQTGAINTALTARACLECGGPLEEFTAMAGEHDKDSLGRDLFEDLPLNQPNVEVFSTREVFPENDGIGFDDPADVREFYRAVPRSMDWIYEHYAHVPGVEDLTPDSPETFLQWGLTDGAYSFGSNSYGRSQWRNHKLVKTAISDVTGRFAMGRYIEMAGNLVLRDSDLFRPSRRTEDVIIPLVKVTCARFLVKDGELQGQGIVRPLISVQNRINMIASQTIDTRQRNGVSGLLVTEGTKLTAGWLDGYTGRVVRYRPDPTAPNGQPQFIETKTIDQGVYQEKDRLLDHAQRSSGAQDVDIGKAPKNVSAATGIQLLLEQVAGRREGRQQEMTDALKDVFSHQLLLLAEYAIEPRQYRVQLQNGKWEYRTFSSMDLEGHTDVVVEEQAGYDTKAFEREVVVQALQMGVLQPTTPYAKREVLKAMGMPMKPLDEENVQMSDFEAKWYRFRDDQIVPVVDPDLDDHWLAYSLYGRFLKSSEGVQLSKDANWPQTLLMIAGWEEKRQQALQMSQQSEMLIAKVKRQDPGAMMIFQGMMQQGEDPRFMVMPKDVSLQILYIWQRMGVNPADPHTRFQAVVRAHKVLGEADKAEAMMGPKLAAPGGASTTAGTQPVLGSSATPGTGTPAEAAALPGGGSPPQA